jgi:hypothetical protein
MELTPMGDIWVTDPETGRQAQVNTSRRRVRERFAAAARAEREEVAAALRRVGADHVILSTEGDWLRDFAHHLRRGEAAVRAGSPSRAAVVARLTAAEGTPRDADPGHDPQPAA